MIVGIVVLVWIVSGAVAHVRQCNEMRTYCGQPIWEDIGTYLMFVPAAIAGPFLFFTFERFYDRHPERGRRER